MQEPTRPEDIARLIDLNEAAALSDVIAAMPTRVARDYGACVRTFGGATAVAIPGTGTAFFNRAIGLGRVS